MSKASDFEPAGEGTEVDAEALSSENVYWIDYRSVFRFIHATMLIPFTHVCRGHLFEMPPLTCARAISGGTAHLLAPSCAMDVSRSSSSSMPGEMRPTLCDAGGAPLSLLRLTIRHPLSTARCPRSASCGKPRMSRRAVRVLRLRRPRTRRAHRTGHQTGTRISPCHMSAGEIFVCIQTPH